MRTGYFEPTYLLLPIVILLIFANNVLAQTLPSLPDGFQNETVVDLPAGCTGVEFLPDGRVLVTNKHGEVYVFPVGGIAVTQFYTVPDLLETQEQGLVGLAVDPGWPARPYLYVNYSHSASNSRVAILTMTGDLTDPSSTNLVVSAYYLLIEIPDNGPWHNGGDVKFGPDGMLYLPTGDDNDRCSVQDPTSLSGKILRLDVSSMPGLGAGPPAKADITPASGNPFPSADPNESLLYAVGVRNPYRIDIDTDGALFVADVGSDYYDEVHLIPVSAAGMNCGWPDYEGPDQHPERFGQCPPGPAETPPAYSYPNVSGACIIGGAVYRNPNGAEFSFGNDYEGDYFAYDFLLVQMYRLQRDSGGLVLASEATGQPSPDFWGADLGRAVDFTVGPDGALYYVVYSNFSTQLAPGLHRITGPGNPIALEGLQSTQLTIGNGGSHTTAIDLTWDAPTDPDAATVELYRKGFGSHPEYDDAQGALPIPPAAPGGDWEFVASVPANTTNYQDQPLNRDFWYYVGFVADSNDNTSKVSSLAVDTARGSAGTLNYHLGDVSDGVTPGVGNSQVSTADVSYLAARYNTVDGDASYSNDLDFGPTIEGGAGSLPATDDKIDFEDLILLALNFNGVSKRSESGESAVPLSPSLGNELALTVPPLPEVGQTFDVTLLMTGNGQVHGLSVPLEWDPRVVAPLAARQGGLLSNQAARSVILTPRLGTVDVALLGGDRGIQGEGTLVAVPFYVRANGDPGFGFASEVIARDRGNQPISMETRVEAQAPSLRSPGATTLHPNVPNPFNPRTTISFELSRGGLVTIQIYAVNGRLVKTLVQREYAAGRYAVEWLGTDESGRMAASGTYLVRMMTPETTLTRRMLLLK